MAYEIYDCEGEIIDPTCDPCLTGTEKARVRSVGYVHKSLKAAINAAPTDEELWLQGIADKKIYIIPETQGSYDGGSPVESPGYGDNATRISGYNFVLNYKDPTYEGNCAFYNSIKKSANWLIAFRTEKLTRISDNPVSINPKDPIAEDLNSEVVWDVEVKWAGDHACPFDTPEGVFVCNPADPTPVEPFTFKFGTGEVPADDTEIAAGTSGTASHNAKATVPDFGNVTDDTLWYAEPVTEPAKTVWYNTITNTGAIGASETFLAPVIVGTWRLYVSGFETSFDSPAAVEFRIS